MGDQKAHLYFTKTLNDEDETFQLIGSLIIDRTDPNTTLSRSQFLKMISCLFAPDPVTKTSPSYSVHSHANSHSPSLLSSPHAVNPGSYYIRPTHPTQSLTLTTVEAPIRYRSTPNTNNNSISTTANFRELVRARDRGCAIRNILVNPLKDPTTAFSAYNACHIIPRAMVDRVWIQGGFYNHVTNMPGPARAKINSIQNGLLLSAEMHGLFDAWKVGIDVDHEYRVVAFDYSDGGREPWRAESLAVSAREEAGPAGVRDAFLRWHFRMCVLANIKGGGGAIDIRGGEEGGGVDVAGWLHQKGLFVDVLEGKLCEVLCDREYDSDGTLVNWDNNDNDNDKVEVVSIKGEGGGDAAVKSYGYGKTEIVSDATQPSFSTIDFNCLAPWQKGNGVWVVCFPDTAEPKSQSIQPSSPTSPAPSPSPSSLAAFLTIDLYFFTPWQNEDGLWLVGA